MQVVGRDPRDPRDNNIPYYLKPSDVRDSLPLLPIDVFFAAFVF